MPFPLPAQKFGRGGEVPRLKPTISAPVPRPLLPPLVMLCLLVALAASGCGLSNWRQTQRQVRLDPIMEQVHLPDYSRDQGVTAPDTVLQSIDRAVITSLLAPR